MRWVVEQSDEKGRIVLSGSRAHHLMKGASESLAGRIRIVELPPLSLRVLGGRLRAAERYGRTMGGCRSVLAFRPRADAHRGGVSSPGLATSRRSRSSLWEPPSSRGAT
ncbi:AAA family ATPase [Enorma phocaeensis]|uniref:AAA family ATPase n=1 Tax=Enorma phocaeensis TaxID=1871019 RepID=A0A921LUB9_9ACTN|nr:AAA family ATPase [Enorma phocaeensis]HJG36635.1 AAA family ATPase [Enorma phocaeensis]